jgi:arsenical pump membrane protein
MPSLGAWLAQFAVPSIAAIAVTYAIVCWFYRRDLAGTTNGSARFDAPAPEALSAAVLMLSAVAIVTASALAGPLGFVTFACAAVAFGITLLRDRAHAASMARDISWRVIALTAALFIVVTALDDAGGFAVSRAALAWCAGLAAPWSNLATGGLTAIASNAINNLPVGLNLGETLPHMHAMPSTTAAALIGVNLGPNATANGSLATILWLGILKRERIAMSWWTFAGVGTLSTIPALAAALLCVR